jgi:hypothetical protein
MTRRAPGDDAKARPRLCIRSRPSAHAASSASDREPDFQYGPCGTTTSYSISSEAAVLASARPSRIRAGAQQPACRAESPQYARTDVESGRALEGGRFRVPTGRVVRARRGGGTGGLRRLCRRDHRANADRGDHASVVQTASVRASRLSTRHVDGGGCSEPGCPGAWIAIRWWIARIHGCGALPTRTRESASAPSGHAGMGADQAGVVLHVRRAGSPFCASDDESERRARCPQDGASGSLDAARAAALADAGVAARSTEPLSESNAALAALL